LHQRLLLDRRAVAVLGVIVVLALPLTPALLHFSGLQYGILAGLTVYAVPQVLAATAPLGSVAVQMGTLVKLVRVLMLGPVVLGLSLLARRSRDQPVKAASHVPVHRLVPWYIVGFLMLVGLRSVDLVPHATLAPVAIVTNLLTVISMAALGLGPDLKTVARAGGRVSVAVALSLLVLGGVSVGLSGCPVSFDGGHEPSPPQAFISCACDIRHMTRPGVQATPPATICRPNNDHRSGFNVPACQIACAGLLRGNAHARTEYVVGICNSDDQPCRHLADGKWPWRRRDRAMRRRTLWSDRRHRSRADGANADRRGWAFAVRADDHYEREAR
jgi:hypothetical protein